MTNRGRIKFYLVYYFLSEILPIARLVLTRGAIFFVSFLAVLYFFSWINSQDHLYALARVKDGAVPLIVILLMYFYIAVYIQRIYSKSLFISKKKQKGETVEFEHPSREHTNWTQWQKS